MKKNMMTILKFLRYLSKRCPLDTLTKDKETPAPPQRRMSILTTFVLLVHQYLLKSKWHSCSYCDVNAAEVTQDPTEWLGCKFCTPLP